MTEEIDTAAQQLEESQSVYTQLQMKANANLSLATVESYAKENLGMRKNRPESIGFVELSKETKEKLYKITVETISLQIFGTLLRTSCHN